MEFSPAKPGEEAGLVVQRDMNNYFIFTLGREDGQTVLRLVQRSSEKPLDDIIGQSTVKPGMIHLKIATNGVFYTFSYSSNGKDWNVLKEKTDGSFLGMAGAGRFTGTFIGIYASSNGAASDNHADFDWFDYQNNEY
jgi:alpha-N-arabinofuranosidase